MNPTQKQFALTGLSLKKRFPIIKLLFLFELTVLLANSARAADDYPYPSASTADVDPWNFYYRQCTSFVAWRMNRDAGTTSSPYYFLNLMQEGHWGNAENWANNAASLDFIVDTTPEVGAIAHWNATEVPSLGHVAYVEEINGDGSVNVSEYNYSSALNYDTRSSIRPPRFIHLRKFVSGNGIQANSSVNVRSTPGGSFVIAEASGNHGTITGGPTGQAYGGLFYKWYEVSWTNGYSGWSIEEALTRTGGSGGGTVPQLSGMNLSNGLFRFILNGPRGTDYVIQSSSNLFDWISISTNTIPTAGWVPISDPVTYDQPMRCYRAVPTIWGSSIH